MPKSLYSITLFCVFLWIPFVYFYYEEKDEDDGDTCLQVKTAFKYTLGFLLVCALLLIIGNGASLLLARGMGMPAGRGGGFHHLT
ncbi:UNVERIFIED_CONTAM: putative lysosomal cobalamin transporter [Gekko kuhli]